MKKTLSKKIIRGHEYYYLSYKKKGVVHSDYLGKMDSLAFKKYLLSLTSVSSETGLRLAKAKNFKVGLPIAYVKDGYLIYQFRDGSLSYLNKSLQVLKKEQPNAGK